MDKCPKKYSAAPASELRDMFNASTIEEARKLRTSIYEEYMKDFFTDVVSKDFVLYNG